MTEKHYRCDNCNCVFIIPKATRKYSENNKTSIHCPYCEDIYSHVISKKTYDKIYKRRLKTNKMEY